MVDLGRLPHAMREHLVATECPAFARTPFVQGPPLSDRRVAIVTTAGLHRRADRPFALGEAEYRIIPGDVDTGDLVTSHVSPNFDRTGFVQDWNIWFPMDRLRELVCEREIGSVARYHYSFLGSTDPEALEPNARRLAPLLGADGVTAVLLVPI